ncbi:metallophosphoesterase [Nitrosomonas communis]|uniref:Calcineurin-like phosphoesterase n=1 Tax=Nitrosomonas communis TaxID=44574 RepID=A0A1I4QTF2_9PROT|nr:metallophosphoesterase [Nitrosomonas communis]SFM43309.1 Calcineurin-like phosphoesterase [Nitrosomonas communis]
MRTQFYDIIGDIHGHADALDALLQKLGYVFREGVYQHNQHKVIFLGDFIDRGPQQREVIQLVKPMIEQGYALSVMGNHEFNAICYATLGQDGKPLRAHDAKNNKQHEAFLAAYPDIDERLQIINWFKTLPVYIDTGGIRVIHASWNEKALHEISTLLDVKQCLIGNVYEKCSEKDSAPYRAIETLLKGPEVVLPDGVTFTDKDGHIRSVARIKWWTPAHHELKERLHLGAELTSDHKLADMTLDSGHNYPQTNKPAFIGHYWMNEEIPKPLSHNCACLDYSIAKGGKLVAYKWRGEK